MKKEMFELDLRMNRQLRMGERAKEPSRSGEKTGSRA